MTTFSPIVSPASPEEELPATMRRQKGAVRRIEQCCSASFKHLPLIFVYGLTTWAAYTGVKTCLVWPVGHWMAYSSLFFIIFFYCMLNWSYTVAVFTDPGSPMDPPSSNSTFSFNLRRKDSSSRGDYSYLPTTEPSRAPHGRPDSPPIHTSNPYLSNPAPGGDHASIRSLTVKADGGLRFCKKCQTRKPDRAHHCSTCGRCVLKMDHHCPWLATCVGLKNYKSFLLFCSYVTLFCCVCFVVSASYVTNSLLGDEMQANGDWFAVNVILLAIMAGIFGLVLAGFTGWHIHLMLKNQTTIEALESTRYLRPIRRTMDRATAAFPARNQRGHGNEEEEEGLMHQLAEMHANAVPGVTREEEGEDSDVPADHIFPGSEPYANSSSHPLPHPGVPVAISHASSAPHLSSNATAALHSSYAQLEARREHDRYEEYLDEQETDKLPHAFDRGWRQNALDLFGPDWRRWLVPLPSTAGDGWLWAPSARWALAQDERRRQREARRAEQQAHAQAQGNGPSLLYEDGIHDGNYGYDYDQGYGYDSHSSQQQHGSVPTTIPHAAASHHREEEFHGVDQPLPVSSSFRKRDPDTSSLEALFPRDDNENEDGEEHARESVEGEWRWE